MQVPPPAPTHVHVSLVIEAGNVSVTFAPGASLGPALLAVIVYVVDPPAVTVVTPSSLVIARSASGTNVSVSDAVLLACALSTTVPGAVIVAVLVMEPVALDAIDALTVNVAVPVFNSDTSVEIGPVPLGVPHAEPALGVHVQLVNVMPGGGLSVTVAPATSLGPELLVTIV